MRFICMRVYICQIQRNKKIQRISTYLFIFPKTCVKYRFCAYGTKGLFYRVTMLLSSALNFVFTHTKQSDFFGKWHCSFHARRADVFEVIRTYLTVRCLNVKSKRVLQSEQKTWIQFQMFVCTFLPLMK